MQILFDLFILFTKLAAFAFGGGYVIISGLIQQSEVHNWISTAELTEIIALAGMTPGPVAMNIAVAYGYKVAGFQGAFVSLLGILLPCAIIVITVATFFFKIYQHPVVKSALYGLRPTITGIIIYAAVNLAVKNGIIAFTPDSSIPHGLPVSIMGIGLFEIKSVIIAVITFIMLAKTKVHPIFLILSAGLVGMIIF